MIYILIICVIIIGFLGFKLFQKQRIDQTALNNYKKEISQATKEWKETMQMTAAETERCKAAHEAREWEEKKLEECRKDLQAALDTYNDITNNKLNELTASIEEQRRQRQEELDAQFEERQANLNLRMQQFTQQAQEQVNKAEEEAREQIEKLEQRKVDAIKATNEQIDKFESILEVLRKYDAEQQEKLFYTIQLPEEYHEDIEFLLTTVAAKVQHPDIISKLVWQEYVKPNLDNTFKRIEIKPEPGIYKLTSLQNGKCYIGKSVDVKKRIADHFKSSVGLSIISDQEVHHIIKKEGFWNWMIEIITYCEKDKLGELEKYYIDFFKSQTYGYNKRAGG